MNRFGLQQQLVYDPTRHITLPFFDASLGFAIPHFVIYI